MALTYEPISTTTTGSLTTSITLSSIPATYTDLVVILQGSMTAGANTIYVRINGDSSSSYQTVYLSSNGSGRAGAVGTQRNDGVSFGNYQYGYAANAEFMVQAHFNNYSQSSYQKTCISKWSQGNSAVEYAGNLWYNTSTISSLEIRNNGGYNFAIGTTVTLYGILAA